jgi:predicted patatin/cPLA2 family phospholipase
VMVPTRVRTSGEPPLYGTSPGRAIAAIKDRLRRRAAGDGNDDGRKIALVIEGGGLRGVFSAGGAVALAQLGLSSVFDEVYATSAAVMNASYFITNQPLVGISVYFDNCTTRSFVNPWRFWKVVDVDYIFDHVAVHEKPLDVRRLLGSPSRLFVAVIDRDTGEASVVDVKSARAPVLQVLKASAALPVFYNRSVDVDGRPYMDGGLVIPFAVRQAVESGCTDVLVLLTRQAEYVPSPASAFSRAMFNLVCARGRAGLNRVYAEKHLRAREARNLALGHERPPDGVSIATVCADPGVAVSRMAADRRSLYAAAISYGRTMLRIFDHPAADTWTLPENCASADAHALEPRVRSGVT